MKIHATQLFRDGCFNADPHAGNFMMLQDDRIGLIDFGATKRLTRGERLTACAIYAGNFTVPKLARSGSGPWLGLGLYVYTGAVCLVSRGVVH